MNETITQEQVTNTPPEREDGMPVDITMDEYVRFQMVFAKKFGRLKMQIPAIILFGIYMLYFLTAMGQLWLETGQFPWAMVIIAVLFAASMACTMLILPRGVRKTAENTYRVCDKNGYYGEWTISESEIRKDSGEAVDIAPLNERTLYIETADCMVFMPQGEYKAIMLPARCMTEEAAAKVREIVFAPSCRVQRRVIARMTAKATAPMARRPLKEEPATLCTVDVNYDENELKKLCTDQAWGRLPKTMPLLLSVSLFLGAAMAMGFENVVVGLLTIPVLLLFYLLAMMMSARRHAKRVLLSGSTRLFVSINERYVTFRQPPAAPVTVVWKHIDRAVETPDSVELYYGGNFMRIPKRVIDDMDALRAIVDRCMKK